MYLKIAISVARRVCHECLQINSALIVLKKVSIAALKLLYLSIWFFQCFWPAKLGEDFTNDIAFKTANDFTFTFTVFGAFANICEGWFMASHSDNCDPI